MSRVPTALDVARAAIGIAESTPAVAARELGRRPQHRELVVYRVLAIRQIVQAIAEGLFGLRTAGMVVDLLHAASMVGVLVFGPRRLRRAASIQAALALLLAVAGERARTRG